MPSVPRRARSTPGTNLKQLILDLGREHLDPRPRASVFFSLERLGYQGRSNPADLVRPLFFFFSWLDRPGEKIDAIPIGSDTTKQRSDLNLQIRPPENAPRSLKLHAKNQSEQMCRLELAENNFDRKTSDQDHFATNMICKLSRKILLANQT
jgi:hypothetical protein